MVDARLSFRYLNTPCSQGSGMQSGSYHSYRRGITTDPLCLGTVLKIRYPSNSQGDGEVHLRIGFKGI